MYEFNVMYIEIIVKIPHIETCNELMSLFRL